MHLVRNQVYPLFEYNPSIVSFSVVVNVAYATQKISVSKLI